MTAGAATLHNRGMIRLGDTETLRADTFAESLSSLLSLDYRVCAYFGDPSDSGETRLYAVVADDINGLLYVLSGATRSGRFPSLTDRHPQVHLFEREIFEQTGALPEGHPWLKPVRFPNLMNRGLAGPGRKRENVSSATERTPEGNATAVKAGLVGQMDFFRMDGDEIHQVAVGPVHAGIIEPGHFRFQCHGETVYHLEISLGYQHRGIEEAMKGGPFSITPFQMETVAGDTTIAHMTAYCQLIETLAQRKVHPSVNLIRSLALELERCANHTGDLGALAGDVGFLPTMSYCGRIRGDFLNLTAALCGNRFGRGLVVPGGLGYDIDKARAEDLASMLGRILGDFLEATDLLWTTSSVMDRFESTGVLTEEVARRIGLVGPAARASGCVRDVRQDHPHGHYRFAHVPVCTYDTGDVFARAYVRWREVQASGMFMLQQIRELKEAEKERMAAEAIQCAEDLAADSLGVSLVEGWRGEVCHVALTDNAGRIKRYKIVDPSFHNWFGLALALRNQAISDFPLCNKSFNLSYCGFDL
jgi:Ni,Fe-hydrogenase III large subunit